MGNDDEMSLLQSVQKATNITWHEGSVSQTDRESLTGQKGATVWFTGLSASGKSTIAEGPSRRDQRLYGHLGSVRGAAQARDPHQDGRDGRGWRGQDVHRLPHRPGPALSRGGSAVLLVMLRRATTSCCDVMLRRARLCAK